MQKHSIVNKKWRLRNPLKVVAHIKVNNAIRTGKLIKKPCCQCGEMKSQAHHSDYNKPLDIKWLYSKCHGFEHRRPENKDNDYSKCKGTLIDVAGNKRHKDSMYFKHKESIIELINAGNSYRQVSITLGISHAQVYKIYNNSSYN